MKVNPKLLTSIFLPSANVNYRECNVNYRKF